MRRTMLSAAAPACLLLGLSPVAAAADVDPPGNATATAAQVSNLVGISSTGASADASRDEAHAAVVSLGGKPALGTGGAQSQEGSSGGALLGKGGPLAAPGVAPLWCLPASGGTANGLTRGAAEVLGVQTALSLNPVAAFSPAASSGTGSTPPPSILPVVANPVAAAET